MCRIGLFVVILAMVYVQDNVNADILDYPYMAAVLFREWETSVFRYQCNGVIISNRHVLTTATCTGDSYERDIKVRVGSSFSHKRGNVHNVVLVRKHFKFSPDLDADIAVLSLSEPLKLSSRVAVVNLPEQDAIMKTETLNRYGVTLTNGIKSNVTYYTDDEVKRVRVPMLSCRQSASVVESRDSWFSSVGVGNHAFTRGTDSTIQFHSLVKLNANGMIHQCIYS